MPANGAYLTLFTTCSPKTCYCSVSFRIPIYPYILSTDRRLYRVSHLTGSFVFPRLIAYFFNDSFWADPSRVDEINSINFILAKVESNCEIFTNFVGSFGFTGPPRSVHPHHAFVLLHALDYFPKGLYIPITPFVKSPSLEVSPQSRRGEVYLPCGFYHFTNRGG